MFVLDTNVVSELGKIRAGRADGNVARWADSVVAADLYLSVITIQELEIGILLMQRRNGVQGAILRAWMTGQVLVVDGGAGLGTDPFDADTEVQAAAVPAATLPAGDGGVR